jgi:hypothetical protein
LQYNMIANTAQLTLHNNISRFRDPRAKRTLSAAAVIGSRFSQGVLDTLGIDPALEDLVAAQLVDQVRFTGQPEYVFHHPLIRTVAYESQRGRSGAAVVSTLVIARQQCQRCDQQFYNSINTANFSKRPGGRTCFSMRTNSR